MDEADRIRLHHGPYTAPACRRGDLLGCEVLGRDVRVGGLTDAPIPWPRALKTGRPSLIVCADLARAVRAESELAVAHHWGVGVVTIWKWRKALGVGPINEGTRELYRGYYPAKITPGAYQKMAETSRSAESRERQASLRRGKPAHPNTAEALAAAARAPRSDEHRRNISASLRGRGRPRKEPAPGSPPLEAIRDAIRADGRSYPEVADAAGVGLGTISRVMGADHDPPLSTVAAILRALGLPFAALDAKRPDTPS